MRRYLLAILCGAVVAVAAMMLLALSAPTDMERITNEAPVELVRTDLPKGSVVLHVKDADDIVAPFALRQDVTAVGGFALTLPEGAQSSDTEGRARLAFSVPGSGKYAVWVRARWRDSCGNSISLRVDQSPARAAGQDAVYNAWHWVNAGHYDLKGKAHRITILEREDGVTLDQIMLTRDESFLPIAPIVSEPRGTSVRRFGDSFDRSPGHETEAWDLASGKWKIEFSLDPNRIPNQYSLVGEGENETAVAWIKGPPWQGCRLSFSVSPLREGEFGAVLEGMADGSHGTHVAIQISGRDATLVISGNGPRHSTDLGNLVQLNQWHRVVIERWAWALRVLVDGHEVLQTFRMSPRVGAVGLFVTAGAAAFDDVEAEGILYRAEDGRGIRMPWSVRDGAKWYRSSQGLVGRRGTISFSHAAMPVQEVVIDEALGHVGACLVVAPGLQPIENKDGPRVFRRAAAGLAADSGLGLSVGKGEVRVRHVAVRYGHPNAVGSDRFRIGPYHFTEEKIEDPSDYLDFTPEEYAQIKHSPEVEKLRREKKYNPLVGSKGEKLVWKQESGRWAVKDGALLGTGPNAVLRYSQEIVSNLELRAKVRMGPSRQAATAEFVFYGEGPAGLRVRIGGKPLAAKGSTGSAVHLPLQPDGKWRQLVIRTKEHEVEAQVDGGDVHRVDTAAGPSGSAGAQARRSSGVFLLKVHEGTVAFDDIEFLIPRDDAHGAFYAFDRRETDWWRKGGQWIDHGGIACVLASNWVSLVAPDREGMLWNKRSFGPDVLVAFGVEENTEWFGWDRKPSHVHHPFDNVRVVLGPTCDVSRGYQLDVNSRGRTATVLYRNGREVASVRQNASFPILFRGGHAPYFPRKSRITLLKRGAEVRAIINDREVLRFNDPSPIPTTKVGIGGYHTRVNFSHIEIR